MEINKQNKKNTEIALLIHCARKEITEEQLYKIQSLTNSDVSWELFLGLVFKHGVATLVYTNLSKHFSQHVPESILSQLRSYFIINAQTNLALFKELLNTLAFLKRHNIVGVPFKGLISAELIYKDLSLRKCGDLDILVKETDFPRARQLFIDQGFFRTLSDQAEIDYLQSGLFHEERKLSIDLHYGIPPKSLFIKVNKLLANQAIISIHDKKIKTLSLIDMFLVICINATKEYWGQKLYQYCDINEFLLAHKDMDLGLVVKRAEKLRCKRMLYTALLVTHEIYNTPIPSSLHKLINSFEPVQPVKDELLKQIFPDDINYQSLRGELFVLKTEKEYFLRLMDKFYIRMLFNLPKILAPNNKDFETFNLPNRMYLLYYLFKPFRVIVSRIRKS